MVWLLVVSLNCLLGGLLAPRSPDEGGHQDARLKSSSKRQTAPNVEKIADSHNLKALVLKREPDVHDKQPT
jgi:hypothetical protein